MPTSARPRGARSGAILILVAGITGLLTSLAIAFIMRMRSDAEEVTEAMHESQARIMLMAACNYVLESGRLGWDDPATPAHEEGFGWIDVATGKIGPFTRDGSDNPPVQAWSPVPVEDSGVGSKDRPAWPAPGSVARCPMQAFERPPYAIAPDLVYNPISTDEADPRYGVPLLRYPDPRPAVTNGWDTWNDLAGAAGLDPDARDGGPGTPTRWQRYARGDLRVRQTSLNLAWFRVYREPLSVVPPTGGPASAAGNGATFVVTCGAGATHGFRDWNEVIGAGAVDEFYGDQKAFEDALAVETRLWYRIEWNAAIQPLDYHLFDHEGTWYENETWQQWAMNASDSFVRFNGGGPRHSNRSQTHQKNQLGTIRWVQRLPGPPGPPGSPRDGKW